MTGDPMNEHTDERGRTRRGRLILALIALSFVIPLLVAAWMQRVALREGVWGGTNHGELIQPPFPLRHFLLPSYQGAVFTLDDFKGEWTLLYVAPSVGECGEECARMLYYMRQVRLALNKDMQRVRRVLLAAPESPWLDGIAQEYEGMHIVFDIDGLTSLRRQLAEAAQGGTKDGIYLIDPLGNAMMVFAPQTDPRDILKDLKKLLRISKVG
jgi:cytochrome oxidase Cu insertion factor (SCO1/SenC/PrrC family)